MISSFCPAKKVDCGLFASAGFNRRHQSLRRAGLSSAQLHVRAGRLLKMGMRLLFGNGKGTRWQVLSMAWATARLRNGQHKRHGIMSSSILRSPYRICFAALPELARVLAEW